MDRHRGVIVAAQTSRIGTGQRRHRLLVAAQRERVERD
jgi:hypothetical protein